MDNTDIRILNALSNNSRTSASELAQKINMSVSAVLERMKKLEGTGIIKRYTTIVDDKKIGLDVKALMGVIMDHPKYNGHITEYAEQQNAIIECDYIAGDFDYMLKIRTDSTQSLERILDEIKSLPGVGRTKTMLVLSTSKQVYSPKIKES